MLKKIALFALGIICMHVNFSFATDTQDKYRHPFYIGVTGGYGSTTWNGLVPPNDKQSAAMVLSTPINVHEGGGIWGILAGYEPIPFFAVEANYTRYPNAKIFFDPMSLVAFENNGLTEINTSTDSVALMAKFMLFIPHTEIRAYSSAGVARVHRQDPLKECWRISPTFGLGFNYDFTDRIMGELGANYTGGYGESELDPAEDYVPFLYSVFLRVAFRFG